MSCQDDLTAVDLHSGVALQVLERVSAGEGRDENLYAYIDHNNVTGLNIEDPESARKIIKAWDDRHDMQVFCESGVDDQSPAGWQLGVDEEGRGAGGRREVEEWPLKVQKMASVSSITLMISDSEGGDKSRLYYLGFKVILVILSFGYPRLSYVSDIDYRCPSLQGESRAPKRSETEGGTVPAANAADAPVPKLAEKQGASHSVVR
ncbi:hypothetical protein QFC19_001570 [Naganishia cerealis]|uniref:Uncharacterized protein n=1 Tax=Naganishia cerealis TaxID=610337 RepID=A0ACC2WH11_9TREE|nr:hypothetical protein QFC19_001570 [Naganishia cerealis]